MRPLSDCFLYTFVDMAYLRGRTPESVAQALCDGGSDLIQLRAKDASLSEVHELALRLLPILQKAGVGLVINDYPEVAAEAGASFCHLGQEDFLDRGYTTVAQVRDAFADDSNGHPSLQIGLSTHSPEQAQSALAAGADYLAVGPVYATPTKPSAKPVTLEYVRWAAAHVERPWFAIGGINASNLDAVLEAGARRVCVVSAVLLAEDIARACQELKERLLSAGRSPGR